MEGDREKGVEKIFNELKLFYTDLNRLIIDYDKPVRWQGKPVQQIKMDSKPSSMVTDQKYLYICIPSSRFVARYTVDTLQLVDKFVTKTNPDGIDISGNELYVYSSKGPISVFNILTKQIIRQWKPPGQSYIIKLNGGHLYYANQEDKQIYIYNLSGDLIRQFGKPGREPGEFGGVYGIEIDDQVMYILDNGHSRVQVYHLLNLTYSHQWGKFTCPYVIRLDLDLCYVGDQNGFQVFTKDGRYLYAVGTRPGAGFGEFNGVHGIIVVGPRLYVTDFNNCRLLVLQGTGFGV